MPYQKNSFRAIAPLGLAICALAVWTSSVDAQTIIGGLIGNDLTDRVGGPNLAGSEGSYNHPAGSVGDLANFDAFFFSSNEPGFGGGEFSFNIFDNNLGGGSNKWCCDGAPVQAGADFGGKQYVLNQFTLSSSNDSPQRDPQVFAIEGSNDGSTWTPIFSHASGNPFTARDQTLRYDGGGTDFATPAAYSMFRYNATSTGSGNHALGEFEIFGDTQPNLSSSVPDGGTLTIEFGPNGFTPGTVGSGQITLTNTGTTNLSEIDILSATLTPIDDPGGVFSLSGFTPTLTGALGSGNEGDGILSDDSGNPLNDFILNILADSNNLVGIDPATAQLEVLTEDDNGVQQTLTFQLQALSTPEPTSILLWSLAGIGLFSFGYRKLRRAK